MALRPGDAVWLRGRIALPDDVRNPGGFDDRAFLARRGVHSVLVVRRPEDVRATEAGGEAAPIARLADALRRSVLRAIVAHMGADDAGLLSGILFSVRAGLPADLQDALSRTGALYILSVSGLELSALAGVVVLILTRTGVPRRAAGAGAACIVWLFVLAAGGASGSERAAILLTVLLLAPLLRRTAEQINSLAVAALLILAREPLALYDSGFQLSFATLAVLLLYAPALERLWLPFEPGQSRRERAGRGILSALLAGAVAHVGSLPLVACYFNQLSFIAPLATVLIAPLSVGVLLAGLATVMLSALVPAALAAPLWALLAAGLHLLRTLVFTLAAVPCAAVSVASPPPLLLITYYALLLIAAPFLRRWALRKALFRPRSGKP
jgi:competence protein ComEC